MKMKALLLGAAASLALAGTANAGFERDGWYFGLEGGAVMVNETQIGTALVEFDHGYGVLGTMGYAFKNSNWRMEGEIGFRQNDGTQTVSCQILVCAPGEVRLKEWTGQTWLVATAGGGGGESLLEKERRQGRETRAEIESDPFVRSVMDAFPGAEIVEIRTIAPPQDVAPPPESEDD